ncbi:MAG: tetratricopeptide repeat protein [Nitrospiraceae bacterium]
MSYRIRTHEKSIPLDEAHLGTWGDRALLKLYDNRRGLIVGAAVLLVAAIIVGTVLWMDQQRVSDSTELLNRATRMYFDRPIDKPSQADQNLKSAVTLLKQLTEQYARTPSASMGLYYLGHALAQQNDHAGAIDAYQKALIAFAAQPSMVGLIQQRLGYEYLAKGEREQAVKAFTAVSETPGALNRDHALFELAHLEETQGRPEGAVGHYQELIKTYPLSPLASEATVRMKVMEVKKSVETNPVPPTTPAPAAAPAPDAAKGVTDPKASKGAKPAKAAAPAKSAATTKPAKADKSADSAKTPKTP